jgi:hypothetical protein
MNTLSKEFVIWLSENDWQYYRLGGDVWRNYYTLEICTLEELHEQYNKL